jgi:hypothetical protein
MGNMAFQQTVPKFISQMLAANPAVKLQGQVLHASGEAAGGASGFDAMARGMLVDAAMSRPSDSAKQPPSSSERERPDYDDEAPQIANLDEFNGSQAELDALLPALARKREREAAEAEAKRAAKNGDAAAGSEVGAAASSASAAAASSPAAPAAASATPALTLSDARLLSVKRARAADADADAIEAQTGKHVFRPAVGSALATAAAATTADAKLSEEERARKRRKKKEAEAQAKSRLTFDESDI